MKENYLNLQKIVAMNSPRIFSFIKTPCGRAKYNELASKKGIIAKFRLLWFILIASAKDWPISSSDDNY